MCLCVCRLCLRLCVCGRWKVVVPPDRDPAYGSRMNDFSLPSSRLLDRQAAWLAPARARLFRRVQIARRRRVLELGCGRGAVTGELARRCGGTLVALDRSRVALADAGRFAAATQILGDAATLPFAAASFDMVFCQLALMWFDAPAATEEIHRVLQPGGVLAAIEPDFGGMIEHPPQIATRDLWVSALARAGADALVGRKLPGLLTRAGFDVHVGLLDRLRQPAADRFELLRELPLNQRETETLRRIQESDAAEDHPGRVVHLPMMLIAAERRGD